MQRYDFLGHSQTDAAAALLGRAFIEFLLDERQLSLGYALTVVTHGRHELSPIAPQRDVDALAVRAVFRGVVQNVEEYLLHAVAVAVDEVVRLNVLIVVQADAALLEQIFVHIDRLVQLDGQVEGFDLELHAAGLDTREVQELLYHAR